MFLQYRLESGYNAKKSVEEEEEEYKTMKKEDSRLIKRIRRPLISKMCAVSESC
jgi:hypothetical protein